MPDATYKYDDDGQVTGVEVGGDVYDVSEEEAKTLAGSSMNEVHDLTTAVRSTVEDMKDSYEDLEDDSVIVDIEATHGGYSNLNNYYYKVDGMKKYVDTWLAAGGRPYLVGHDMKSENKGRVDDAEFVSTGADTGYHALDVMIADEKEVQRIIDGRSLTVSVGSVPVDPVECSICGHDILNDGKTPTRYQLDEPPSREWLNESAPGVFGRMGMDNKDFWDYEEDDDGNHSCKCRHKRGIEAPLGGEDFVEIDWILHGNRYREVSRVNLPADQNRETGEYAHIRGLQDALAMTDGLDAEASREILISETSKVGGPVDRAHFQIAREKDLYRPGNAQDAIDFAKKTQLKAMYDTGLWELVTSTVPDATTDQQVRRYWKNGGRFLDDRQVQNDNGLMTPAEAIQLKDPTKFGDWLRKMQKQSDADREDLKALDRLYSRRYVDSL